MVISKPIFMNLVQEFSKKAGDVQKEILNKLIPLYALQF